MQHLVEQQAVDAAPHAAQLERRRVPQLGDGADAGAVQPLLHARADAVDHLQCQAEQNLRQVVFGDDDQPVRFLQVGTDLAEEDVRRDADRTGEAFADLVARGAFELERELARGRYLALGAHQPAGHLVDRANLVDRQAGVDRFQNALVIIGVDPENREHAQFIVGRFDINYPHLKGSFARAIDYKTEYAQSLLDDFYQADKAPHIAVSIDMLDTGIDVPEIVNLVFFKIVRSKTKFWQMLGRGTRLCPDLFGPGRHKEFFHVFDFCQNFEFFNQNPQTADGAVVDSLAKRLFVRRVELVGEIDKGGGENEQLQAVRYGVPSPRRSCGNEPGQLHCAAEAALC